MTIGASLAVGWWNTGLTRPGAVQIAHSSSRLAAATTVIHALLSDLPVLVLGEVTADDVEQLLAEYPEKRRLARIFSGRRNMAVLYDTRYVANLDLPTEFTHRDGQQDIGIGWYVKLSIGRDLFHVIAVHWPSRRVDGNRRVRYRCGVHLKTKIDQLVEQTPRTRIIVIGDFNDEPFDDSLCDALRATRDRNAAKRSAALLYNPFWRVLGEYAARHDTPLGAGTHFYTRNHDTSWYTLDQAIVSSSLVQGSGWTLAELATNVLPVQQLLTKSGNMSLNFDHLPIVIAFECLAEKGVS